MIIVNKNLHNIAFKGVNTKDNTCLDKKGHKRLFCMSRAKSRVCHIRLLLCTRIWAAGLHTALPGIDGCN